MATDIEVRALRESDINRCREILYSLPDWFGIEASNQAYIKSLSELPGAVATADRQIDPQYERTRQFYLGCGFETLFETLELWGPENSALIMVKYLQPGGAAA